MSSKLSYFNGGSLSNYSIEEGELRTGALILVEGSHTDSKNRKHVFDKKRIHKIANKTNILLEQGGNIPLLQDHVKTVDSTVGNLESPVWVDIITEENLPNKKAKHLLGKLGIFAEEIAIKTESAIEKVSKNIVKTISAGLDIATDTIREISLTSTPAIAGMSLYKSAYSNAEFENNGALTFDDLDNDDSEMQQMEQMYGELTEKLWQLTKNIQMADEDMLQGNDPMELQMQAVQDFVDRFRQMIGMGEEDQQQEMQQDPRMQMQNQGYNPNGGMGGRQFESAPVAAFSMADMEQVNIAAFGYRKAISSTYKALANKGTSGQTLGQIGSKFGRKMLNATKGKIAGIGRGFNRLRNELGSNPVARSTVLSAKQQSRASKNYKKTGGLKSTATPGGTMNLGNDSRLKPSPMVSPSKPKPKTFGEFNP